uniref:hypothetical protein n=1 Tax=Vibrio vulnificus TaxID=672 RepID=UPI0039B6CEF4
ISLAAYAHFMHYAYQVHRHRKEYPLYEHHRPISLGYQLKALVNWSFRNLIDLVLAQPQRTGRWAKDNADRYYLVALQVQTD